jgi:hypothetical protein
MANDTRSIGEKLRAMEEHAAKSDSIPANRPENKEPAEGSRENAGGISNRPLGEEQRRQENVPPRGKSKGGGHA